MFTVNDLIRHAAEVEKSKCRFEAVGANAEEVEFLIQICSRHRTSFELDKQLAQIIVKGDADADDIKVLQYFSPKLFNDFKQTYLRALSKKLTWRKLLETLNTEALQ